MAKPSEDPPSPVDAYSSSSTATPVGEVAVPTASASGYYGVPSTPVAQVPASKPFDDWTVVSIIALFASCIGFTVPGIVLGHLALHKLKTNGQAGRGLAIAALVVGYILFVVTVVLVVAWALLTFWAVSAGTSTTTFGSDLG